jgi:hypothetical protein
LIDACRYYTEAARQGRILARRKPPAVPIDAPSNDHLKRVFRSYCKLRVGQGRQVGASVQHINAAQFNQMCRDAGLLEPHGESHGEHKPTRSAGGCLKASIIIRLL